jgi:anti-sigma-K factor RskA
MSTPQNMHERLVELATGEALSELSVEEAAEYAKLRGPYPNPELAASVRVVGAALQALVGRLEPLPVALAARIERQAQPVASRRAARSAPTPGFAYGGWFAAAASLLVALFAWRLQPVSSPPAVVTAAAERASLLNAGRALVQAKWSSGGDTSGLAVQGDVVWDPVRQTGYMRFSGLARNNPTREQYQLWIFDKDRDQRYPVDGGTFDVTASGEVVVRIQARLHVATPTLFAVTVERPGGVVVSSRARMAAVAQTG